MSLPQVPDPSPEFWAQFGWVDRSVVIVLAVFLFLGMFRGLGWQLGRIAILLVAYAAALLAGPLVGTAMHSTWGSGTDSGLAMYLGGAVVFVGALIVTVLIERIIRLRRVAAPATSPSGVSRIGGAALGVVSGALVALALLTVIALVPAATSLGGSVAEAAERSHAGRLGRAVIDATRTALPSDLRAGADAWNELFEPASPHTGPTGPDDPAVKRLDAMSPGLIDEPDSNVRSPAERPDGRGR